MTIDEDVDKEKSTKSQKGNLLNTQEKFLSKLKRLNLL